MPSATSISERQRLRPAQPGGHPCQHGDEHHADLGISDGASPARATCITSSQSAVTCNRRRADSHKFDGTGAP